MLYNIEAKNNNGATPLHIAAQAGQLGVVEYLQETRANIEVPDKDDKTPLMIATQKGYSKVVQLLVQKGAQANQ